MQELKLLNVFYNTSWVYARAQNDYTDLFNVPIKDGELYYFLSSIPENIKLSESSMSKLLYILFGSSSKLTTIATQIHTDQINKLKDVINKIHK